MLLHLALSEGYWFVSKDAAASAYAELGLQLCW